MKNKKGFTLIELLVTIIILSILLIIIVPKVSNVIENARKGAFKSTNSMIVSELARENALEITPQVYTFTDGVISPELSISGELPKNGTIEINAEGKIQVVTSNDDYCAIKRFDEDTVAIFESGDRNCNVVVEITLTVDPNGGIYEGNISNTTYQIPTEDFQVVNNPTRDGYTFDGWTLEGEGTYSAWLFQAGFTDATLTANWLLSPTLTVNANSGTWSGTTPQIIISGNTATIANPTRSNYTFTGWTVSGAGSLISGTTFTMGTENATLTANWTINTYTLTVNANGGTWSGTTPQNIAVGGTTTINAPTRNDYLFNGWTVSGNGSSMSGTTFTMGTANTTLTANWTERYVYFYDSGNENTAKTGGWVGYNDSVMTFTKYSTYMYARVKGNDSGVTAYRYFRTTNMIDLSNIKTLYITYYGTRGYLAGMTRFGIVNSVSVSELYHGTMPYVEVAASATQVTLSVNVAAYDSSYYLMTMFQSTGSTTSSNSYYTYYYYKIYGEVG